MGRCRSWRPGAGPDRTRAAGTGRTEVDDYGVDELCGKFAHVCESAVDPLEISSALEFEGLSDQAARDRYGLRDVFALAEEMYRRVPRRPAEPEEPADPWQISKVRSALHGLLYGLPTACFPAAAGLLTGRGVLTVLIVALLASWAISQALAYLGHARMGQAESAQAARLLLGGTAGGTAGVVLATAVTAIAVHARVTALVFGVGLGTYMVGATVLMVLGAERLLLAVLAPAVLGAASFLMAGRPPQLEHAVWGALASTPLLALGLAAARAWQLGRSGGGQPGQVMPELRRALPSAGFGLVAAGLLVFPFAASGHGVDTGAQLASLPLALSMGAAEWTLVWFRRRTQRLLRTTRELLAFATRARLALVAALLQYLSAATVLTAAVLVTATATGLIQLHWDVLPQIATYLALGGAMFMALLLQAFGVRGLPADHVRRRAGSGGPVAPAGGARTDRGLRGAVHRADRLRGSDAGEGRAPRVLGRTASELKSPTRGEG